MRAVVLVLLPMVVLAGCATAPERTTGARDDDPVPGPVTYRLGGVFERNATQADVAEAQALARAEGGDMAVMESFPMQFAVTGPEAAGCERLRAALGGKPFVASVGACQEAGQTDAPDTPTGSPPSSGGQEALPLPEGFQEPPGPRSFRGTFTRDFTDADVRAVCVAATGNPSCAMMNSLPPQYAFTFASLEACEAARGKVLAVPHVADVSRCAGERDHRLSVTLLFSATQEEGDDVRRLVAAVGGQTGALGPSGREWRAFLVDEMDAAACARLRLALEGRAHVEHLGECHAMPREYPPLAEPPGNETGLWSFHGYFTSQGMRYDATVAACEAVGIEAAQCNMPAPWPPQFGFHFDGRAECEPARARVLELPFVTGVGPCQPGDAWP